MITERARAKVNLTLHVTGRRKDGYHTLHSLVVFPDIADRLTFEAAEDVSLFVEGPRVGDLAGLDPNSNLVLRAACLLAEAFGITEGVRITLEKNLPVAAGIGGGSADAAAAIRGLVKLWSLTADPARVHEIALQLGADTPVCLASQSAVMSGIGEIVELVTDLAAHWLVLVNCNRPVETRTIFQNLDISRASGASLPAYEELTSFARLVESLGLAQNDLQETAAILEPQIQTTLDALNACDGIALARMSGSGATCFGLFEKEAAALTAERELISKHPVWWICAAKVD